MHLSVLIPNYNGKNLLRKNLPQVLQVFPRTQVVVVDDASTDESVDFLRKHYPQIRVVSKFSRSGFATSVNLGMKAVTGDIVVLLNTDVVPENVNIISKLEKLFSPGLAGNGRLFAVGFTDLSRENGQIIKRGRGIGKFHHGFLTHNRGRSDRRDTLWVSGGSGAFDRRIWDELGGLDEIYNPFYWEDIDLGYRALKSGYNLAFAPDITVRHDHEQGAIKKYYSDRQIRHISYRNQFIFHIRNITDASLRFSFLFWWPLSLIKAIFRRDWPMLTGFISALGIAAGKMRVRRLRQSFKLSDRQTVGRVSYV